MDQNISKIQMKLAIKRLERMASEITDVPTFRGFPVSAFEKKEHLVMLCQVFGHEWIKAAGLNDSLLESQFVGKMNLAYYTAKARNSLQAVVDEQGNVTKIYDTSPSFWRRKWNWIKGSA